MNSTPAFRHGTWDELIYNQVFLGNEYGLPDKLPDNTIVVDIGAHIASFSMLALHRGARRAYAFEAGLHNFKMCEANLYREIKEGRSHVFNAAVWHSQANRLPYSMSSDAKNTGGNNTWSLPEESKEYDMVRTVTLDNIVGGIDSQRFLKPGDREPSTEEYNLIIKIDAEGSEFGILYASELFSKASLIVGEYHDFILPPPESATQPEFPEYNHVELERHLQLAGYKTKFEPTAGNLGHFFAEKV